VPGPERSQSPEVRDREDVHYPISGVNIGRENDDDKSPFARRERKGLVDVSIDTLNHHTQDFNHHHLLPLNMSL